MKKKILFCLAALGAASMLSGFDSAETAESLLEKMQTASSEAESVSMDMDFNMNVGVNIGDGTTTSTLNIAASGGFDIAANTDPLALSMDGSMTISALGTNEEVSMKMYSVANGEDQLDTYIYTEDSTSGESGWEHESAALDTSITDLITQSSQIDMSEYGLAFELSPEAADVDGTECYLLTAVMDSDSFSTLMDQVSELTGEEIDPEELEMVMSMLNGIKIRFEYYVDTATYLPVKFHLDMNDSDVSALNQYVAMAMGAMDEGTTVTIDLNDISFDATLAYGDAIEITVPEEALAAAESGESSSDLTDALEDVADEALEAESEVADEVSLTAE